MKNTQKKQPFSYKILSIIIIISMCIPLLNIVNVNAYNQTTLTDYDYTPYAPIDHIIVSDGLIYVVTVRNWGSLNEFWGIDLHTYDEETGEEVIWYEGRTVTNDDRNPSPLVQMNSALYLLKGLSIRSANVLSGSTGCIINVLYGAETSSTLWTIRVLYDEDWTVESDYITTTNIKIYEDSGLTILNPDYILASITRPYPLAENETLVGIVTSVLFIEYNTNNIKICNLVIDPDDFTLIDLYTYTVLSASTRRIGKIYNDVSDSGNYYTVFGVGDSSSTLLNMRIITFNESADNFVNSDSSSSNYYSSDKSLSFNGLYDNGFNYAYSYITTGIRYIRTVFIQLYEDSGMLIDAEHTFAFQSDTGTSTPFILSKDDGYTDLYLIYPYNGDLRLEYYQLDGDINLESSALGDWIPYHYETSIFTNDDDILFEETTTGTLYIYTDITNPFNSNENPTPVYTDTYNIALSYLPYDNPVYVNKMYTFTVSATLNETSYSSPYNVKTPSGLTVTSGNLVNGVGAFTSYFNVIGATSFTVVIFKLVNQEYTPIYNETYSFIAIANTGGTGGSGGSDIITNPEIFSMSIINSVLTIMPLAIVVLLPAFYGGQAGGLIGYALGGVVGIATAIGANMLPFYWIYIVALIIIMAFVFVIRNGGGGDGGRK